MCTSKAGTGKQQVSFEHEIILVCSHEKNWKVNIHHTQLKGKTPSTAAEITLGHRSCTRSRIPRHRPHLPVVLSIVFTHIPFKAVPSAMMTGLPETEGININVVFDQNTELVI